MRLSWRRMCRRLRKSSTACWPWPTSRKTISSSTWAAATAGFRSPRRRNTAPGAWASTSTRCASTKPTPTRRPPASRISSSSSCRMRSRPTSRNATVVTTYLLSASNLRLRPIMTKQLKPGSRIVTHSFSMGDWAPTKTDTFNDADRPLAHDLSVSARMVRFVSDRLSKSSGLFYLGREVDPDTKARSETPLLYDSSDLVTHAVIAGMTGSGKTGLGIDVIEEAAIDGIPVIAIDPKGDLGNLLLDLPSPVAGGFRAVGRCGRSAPRRPDAGGVCRRRSGEVVEGPGRVGPGRRAHRAAARGRRVRALHAGQHRRPAAVDRQVVRGAGSGNRQRRGPAAGSRRARRRPAC